MAGPTKVRRESAALSLADAPQPPHSVEAEQAVLGGLLGYERETKGASAGLRTHMLVSVGSALFVLIPLQAGMSVQDLSRVLQGVTAGIGFLGAGAILKQRDNNDVKGLTTAASVWMTAAIGVAAGMGREGTAVLSALFGLVILAFIRSPNKRSPG